MTDSQNHKHQKLEPIQIHVPDESKHDNHYSPRAPIYVREVKGILESFRRYFGFFFLALFVLLPFIDFNGQQALLIDVNERRLNLFHLSFWTSDFTLVAWLFIIAAFALFFVTTFIGRVWCGFMCPQTTWSYIFMWIEKKCEGQRHQRIKLDQRSWDSDKFMRKSLKHVLWGLVALLTAMVFIGYFVPIKTVFTEFWVGELSTNAYLWIAFFTLCTYGNAGWMREAMCTHICPYARFQSVMFDEHTLTVTYDQQRGENRGPRSRKNTREENSKQSLGDCIDCNLCVQVCPTGIDIRNGLQYECINCGACVDACNDVMKKMRYPLGLIKFTSERKLKDPNARIMRPKLFAYAAVLILMIAGFGLQLQHRSLVTVDVSRDRNILYRETPSGLIENAFTISVTNKTQQTQTYQVSVKGIANIVLTGKETLTVAGGETYSTNISLAANPYDLNGMITDVEFSVTSLTDSSSSQTINTTFIYR